jgi:type IV secretory pathway ATPase VirB11/archaellum biosynthesis ATPase
MGRPRLPIRAPLGGTVINAAVLDAYKLANHPDRTLVGEVRDGSALELLKQQNAGHPEDGGSKRFLTSVNGPHGVIA